MPPEIQEMNREQLLEVVKAQYHEKEKLQAELAQLKKMVFGSKSERFVPETDPQQTSLDFGQTPEVPKKEPATETITYERKKNGGKEKPSRQPIPAHLERVVHIIQPEEDVTGLVTMGKEVTEFQSLSMYWKSLHNLQYHIDQLEYRNSLKHIWSMHPSTIHPVLAAHSLH